jgi:hypothetical protein
VAVEPASEAVGLALDLPRAREELFEERSGELLAFDHVPKAAADGHQKTPFPVSQDRT